MRNAPSALVDTRLGGVVAPAVVISTVALAMGLSPAATIRPWISPSPRGCTALGVWPNADEQAAIIATADRWIDKKFPVMVGDQRYLSDLSG